MTADVRADRFYPPAVIERDLNRLMGLGLVAKFSMFKSRGQRVYHMTLADGSTQRWGPQATYAFVVGAMSALDQAGVTK
jgi:hypothetical protein